MSVNIAVLKETRPFERRVALAPVVVPKLIKLGVSLHMQSGAGNAVNLPDTLYDNVAFANDRQVLASNADIVLAVQPPDLDVIDEMKEGSILVSFIYEAREPELVKRMLDKRITCFAMERIPRISRAQTMDALSSQAALSGFYGVMAGSTHLLRILPKVTAAAGVIGPARVLVMGLGVAGLQAIATAHRLGAVVEGYDVRPETEEQALSLGAKFLKTGIDARGAGGYARELTADEKATIEAVVTQHIQQADMVITTAAIPGRPSPKLINHAQLMGMKTGSVIVDLSAEGGGNCEDTRPGETITVGPVTIVAPINAPSLLGEDASKLYSQNLYNLLAVFVKDGAINIDWDDEVLAKTALTHDGVLKSVVPKPVVVQEKPPAELKDVNPSTVAKGY